MTQYLNTVGYMATRLQRSVADVERWLAILRAEPVLVLNGMRYFSSQTHDACIRLMCAEANRAKESSSEQ